MNVYDFDKTIFYPDSSYCFCRFCYKKYPKLAARLILPGLGQAIRYKMSRGSAKALKETMFSFLGEIQDVDALVAEFWEENFCRIGQWYLTQKRPDDLIISASPDFLVRPAAQRLGVGLIATDMDKKTGEIRGENCHDVEKVVRFNAEYPGGSVEEFYSDSLSDTPMAELAERAFLVKKERLAPWPWDGLR